MTLDRLDPAFPLMLIEILQNILLQADNPAATASYLVDELRELTGAKCVIIYRCTSAPVAAASEIMAIQPARRLPWACEPEIRPVIGRMQACGTPVIISPDSNDPASTLLSRAGLDISLSFPLHVGPVRLGTILLMGLPDETHLDDEIRLLETLSGVFSLVLRTGFLFENQEAIIRERTRELESALVDLGQSEARYRLLFASSPLGIGIGTIQGAIIDANPAILEMTGYPLDELKAIGISGLYADPAERTPVLAALQTRGTVREHLVRLRRSNGALWLARLNIDILKNDRVEQIVTTLRDVTEYEAALQREKMIEARLMQVQKLEAIGTMAGGVAHEINNPLTGVINYAQLIHDMASGQQLDANELSSRVAEYSREIINESNRIAVIVRSLLTFSRSDHHEKTITTAAEIIESLLSLIRKLLEKDEIRLVVEMPDPAVPLVCHPGQIRQVLLNLITNARDSLNERYPRTDPAKILEISVKKTLQSDRPMLCFSVTDHGTGISPDDIPKLFDPFFSTKAPGKGTGLGLPISYSIVREHGGEIIVESMPGKGTCMTVALPACHNDQTQNPDTANQPRNDLV